jgi:hypothetical protein
MHSPHHTADQQLQWVTPHNLTQNTLLHGGVNQQMNETAQQQFAVDLHAEHRKQHC